MPFTLSHAVVALPFVRTPLIPAAIAIGAMTPDLPLFLRGVGVNYSFTHSVANVIWTALIALVLFLLWHAVLRPAVSELAPRWVARRLPDDWNLGAGAALRQAIGGGNGRWYASMLLLSLVIGVLSHIVWDLFTHEGRWGVEVIPALSQLWGPLLGVKWLQHGSSVLGLAIIGVWVLLWLRRRQSAPIKGRLLPGWVRVSWWVSLPIILVVAWVIGFAALGPFSDDFTYRHLAYRVLPSASAIWGVVTLGLCIVVGIARSRRR